MADLPDDHKAPIKRPRGPAKGSKTMLTKVKEATEAIEAERADLQARLAATVKRDDQGRLLQGSVLTTGKPRWLSAAAWLRAKYPNGELLNIAGEVADGSRRATREQTTMLKDLLDRCYGRSPETHLVSALPEASREAAAELTKEQLLSLLDGSAEQSATQSATVDGQVIEATEPTH